MCLGVSEPTKWLAAQSTATALPNRQGNQTFFKENKNKCMWHCMIGTVKGKKLQ